MVAVLCQKQPRERAGGNKVNGCSLRKSVGWPDPTHYQAWACPSMPLLTQAQK